jgi:hypothetical protein
MSQPTALVRSAAVASWVGVVSLVLMLGVSFALMPTVGTV